MKTVLAVLSPLVLAGCGLPPAITVISYALDGLSLFSTGKTVSDHALSVAMKQDCMVWRAVRDQSICRDLLPGEKNQLIAQAEKWRDGPEVVGQDEPATPPSDTALVQAITSDPVLVPNYLDGLVTGYEDILQSDITSEMDPTAFSALRVNVFGHAGDIARPRKNAAEKQPNQSQARMNSGWNPPDKAVETIAAGRRAAETGPAAGEKMTTDAARVLVLGSFGKQANAARAALKWRDLGVTVVPSRVGAARMYRVVTAPVAGSEYGAELRRVRSIGFKDAWGVRLCGGGDAKPGACISLRASATQ